ncbi:hypothetical protein AQ490_21655 [Wenjunlia vitaminophila]|uniref:IPT/TIG domain-containing protein n=1 Tax=Wenjunlia vitaminophila TaxID=76728 RepID=A0A0T6LTD6_WENVI|nr:IPT/TIG domain-containing protein [Wenjunlia vitaminophila]KRV49103.1 hypothetical protein AQ490_21655 [Wenjunlia vitaminophila]
MVPIAAPNSGVLASTPPHLLLPHTIAVGPAPVGIVVTPDGATGYVADSGGAEITVVSTATDTVSGTVPVGSGPRDLAISPNGARLYATRPAAGVVSVISTASNTVTASIAGFTAPRGLAVSPDGSSLYVADSGTNAVKVASTATNAITGTVNVAGSPDTVVVAPNGAVVYASVPAAGVVSVISTASNTVTASITGFTAPRGLAVSPDGSSLYVADSGTDAVKVASTATNAITGTVAPAASPESLAFSPDGTLLYATSPGRGLVTVTNPVTATVVTTLTGLGSPQRVASTPDSHRLYVTNGGGSGVTVLRRPASITPHQGSRGGGATVTITGQGFTGTTAVRFGASPAAFTVVDDDHLTVVTPSNILSNAPVNVTSPGGTATVGFFYYRRLPLLEQLSVTSGPVSGGTPITVTGRRFIGVKGFWFGRTLRTPTVLSDTAMTVVAPPSSVVGNVPVHTANQGGVSNTLGFTYLSSLTITSISPTSGPRTGSRPVNINGTGFTPVTGVTVGGAAALAFKVTSDVKIQVITPPGPPGPAAVVVTTGDGRTATSPVPYTYT